jgi:hypothetical protein
MMKRFYEAFEVNSGFPSDAMHLANPYNVRTTKSDESNLAKYWIFSQVSVGRLRTLFS